MGGSAGLSLAWSRRVCSWACVWSTSVSCGIVTLSLRREGWVGWASGWGVSLFMVENESSHGIEWALRVSFYICAPY